MGESQQNQPVGSSTIAKLEKGWKRFAGRYPVIPYLLRILGFLVLYGASIWSFLRGWAVIISWALFLAFPFICLFFDYRTAKRKGFQMFWSAWLLVFLFAISVVVMGLKERATATKISELNKTLLDQDGIIRDFKARLELTPDEQKEWDMASNAFERGKLYRDQKTNWFESAKAFEEAYVDSLPVALRHSEHCEWVAHLAGDLVGPYEKLNRHTDAVAAADAKLVLQNLPRQDFVLGSTSPAIYPAIDLYDKLSNRHSQ